jgi:hypothetical protein
VRSRASLGVLLVVTAFAFMAAYPMQVNGWNQNAHYALVRALSQGTPMIDKTRTEIGDLGTGDVTLVDGHYYSNKAPGLAFVTVPAFVVVEAVGMRTTGDPTRVIWALHIWSIALPAVLLVIALRLVADDFAPGFGTAAAATLGIATLVLPFSTLFFSHVLAATLAFLAFALLWHERRGASDSRRIGLAGVLAGYAVTTEYTSVLAGLALWALVLARAPRLRRALAYMLGIAVGIAPLAAYNVWAFGSPTHLSYEQNQVEPIGGFFGIGIPSGRAALDLLFSGWGLLTHMPVVALGIVGAVLLVRSGRRAEGIVLLAVPALAFLHDTAIQFSPFGGLGLPRYLIYSLPFACAAIGLAYRELPLTAVALAAVSAWEMIAMTATNPLAAYDLSWADRFASRDFSQTGASIVGVTGWYTIGAFFAAAAVAITAVVWTFPRFEAKRRDVVLAGSALAAWLVLALLARTPTDGGKLDPSYAVAVALGAAAATAALAIRAHGVHGLGRPAFDRDA